MAAADEPEAAQQQGDHQGDVEALGHRRPPRPPTFAPPPLAPPALPRDARPAPASDSGDQGTSVRSATRSTAERERGLPDTSDSDGLRRPMACSISGLGAANGTRRSTSSLLCLAMKVLTMRSSSEWKLMTARRPPGASIVRAEASASSSSPS